MSVTGGHFRACGLINFTLQQELVVFIGTHRTATVSSRTIPPMGQKFTPALKCAPPISVTRFQKKPCHPERYASIRNPNFLSRDLIPALAARKENTTKK
ncbi:hypothetical protein PCANC_03231 [Puccinia coronata f. sp. avenae]|uniref:Uncharacterized protein n=1 Tax=Puccinia coronata f. sp. avenae TaxID=200324 RepID=A0A2N5T896_9BASI|nr:hypothetical protein PCANC_02873 [Puccinia coronata f. sp. avenae]PLW55201.1 hypothetical protein PCANC_03231 [Puccinia coronata f. sp. avenae]